MAGDPPRFRLNPRVDAVDVLRGLVMIVMALDHTRDYFGDAAANPTNLATTTAALFATRWITHICAPTFFLLTGAGAYLSRARRPDASLPRYLVTRGLWLVALELTVMRAILQFNVDYRVTLLNVLWALGWSMVALGTLVWLPTAVVGAIGVAMIALHNLADGVPPATFGALAPLWTVLHQPGLLYASPPGSAVPRFVLLAYPLIPWIGVTAVGYALGAVLTGPAPRRQAFLWRAGVACAVAFVAIRFINGYGDPSRWAPQRDALFTALSFLNTTKYPPSLLFLLMTLGPALLALWAIDRRSVRDGAVPPAFGPALVIGRVPLFYFLLHFALIHLLAVLASAVRYGAVHWLWESPTPDRFPFTQPPGWPLPLAGVYALWALVVVLAYPCCRWYAGVKARHPHSWLRYL